jgi:hypothetical protein
MQLVRCFMAAMTAVSILGSARAADDVPARPKPAVPVPAAPKGSAPPAPPRPARPEPVTPMDADVPAPPKPAVPAPTASKESDAAAPPKPAKTAAQERIPQAILDAVAEKLGESRALGKEVELREKTLNSRKLAGDITPEEARKERDAIFDLVDRRIDCIVEADRLYDAYYRLTGKPRQMPAAKKAEKKADTAKAASPPRRPSPTVPDR